MGDVSEPDKSVRIENGEFHAMSRDMHEVARTVSDRAVAARSLEVRPLKWRIIEDIRALTIYLENVSQRLADAADQSTAKRRVV